MVTLIIVLVVTVIMILFVFPILIISEYVFTKFMVRTKKTKWTRACSDTTNEEQVRMFDEGLKWAEGYKDKIIEVEIKNDGLRLVGEYFDFGYKKCVIILQGRTESLWYSYYYAKPYPDLGYNILVIDSRAHGLSEGKYNTAGLKEYKDVLKWTEYIKEKFKIEKFLIHGICIGSATGLYAVTSKKLDCYEGIITDGMYTTFYESFKTHMVDLKKPVHPVVDLIMVIMILRCKVNMKRRGPIRSVADLNIPILFLYSKEDKFSLPAKSQILYDKTPEPKRIVWFDKGAHSHIRINNVEKYDEEIKKFIEDYLN